MYKSKKINIEVRSGGVSLITHTLVDDSVTTKLVPTALLFEGIARGTKVESDFELWVPPTVRYIKKRKNVTIVVLEVPPTRIKMRGRAQKVPATCWICKVNERGNMLDSRVYGLRGSLLGLDTTLYPLHLSNCHSYGGQICWGDVRPKATGEPITSAVAIVACFFASEFNGDLYSGKPGMGDGSGNSESVVLLSSVVAELSRN